METKTSATLSTPLNPEVQHLIHVICLPLQLKRKGNPVASIDDAVQGLTVSGSSWCETDGPLLAELSNEQRWQARVYFHPFVRRFLFDPQRSRWLQRGDIKSLRVTLPKTMAPVTLTVLRCQLALFQPDIACLLLELDCQESLPIDTLQRLLDRLRRIYPPYFDSFQPDAREDTRVWFGGHCADRVELLDSGGRIIGPAGGYAPNDYTTSLAEAGKSGAWNPNWAVHWQTLLAPLHTAKTLVDESGIGIRQFGDDRAAIISYVAVDNVSALNDGQWVRICFADDQGSDALPYAKSFLSDFEKKHCYDRYWYQAGETTDSPSRILNCGYAFSYVGKVGDWFFEKDPTGALFTFRHIYVFMGVIAHMQRAAMLAASHRLTDMVQRDGNHVKLPDPEEVRNFYKQFVEFTQTYWFDEVTPQEQGQQIFAQWQLHLRTLAVYNEVRQELRDLAEHSELQASRKELEQSKQLNETVGRLGIFSLALAALGVAAGILGMNIPEEMGKSEFLKWLTGGGLALLVVLVGTVLFNKEIRTLIKSAWRNPPEPHSEANGK